MGALWFVTFDKPVKASKEGAVPLVARAVSRSYCVMCQLHDIDRIYRLVLTHTWAADSSKPPEVVGGMYVTLEPARWANSRMPWTLLCESSASTKELAEVNGKDSPTSLRAADALLVKMTSYSPSGASKYVSTA
jgi:hypothetical protein